MDIIKIPVAFCIAVFCWLILLPLTHAFARGFDGCKWLNLQLCRVTDWCAK